MFAKRAASGFAVVLAVLAGASALASSHREAPLISQDPAADGTDLFAWRNGAAGAATVTLVADYWPLALAPAGPNYFLFDDHVMYEIKVDNHQDAKPHISYQFTFKTTIHKSPLPVPPAAPGDSFLNYFAPVASATDANILRAQAWTLTKVTIPAGGGRPTSTVVGNGPVCPWNVGIVTDPNYGNIEASCIKTFGTTKVFVGPRDDPFFVNLHQTFDFLGYGVGKATSDDLAGANVLSLVVEVPATDLTGGAAITDGSHAAADQLGIWTTASRPRVAVHRWDGSRDHHGGWIQVSRLGNPLINEVIVPLVFKDFFNASKPENDVANYGAVVLDPELAYLMNAKGFIPKVPPAPRTDIITTLLAPANLTGWANYTGTPDDVLHLDVSVPPCTGTGCNTLGVLGGDVAGFPNGRRLSDRVTDEALAVVGGVVYKAFGAQDANDLADYATPAKALLSDNLNPLANDAPFNTTFPYLATPWAGNP